MSSGCRKLQTSTHVTRGLLPLLLRHGTSSVERFLLSTARQCKHVNCKAVQALHLGVKLLHSRKNVQNADHWQHVPQIVVPVTATRYPQYLRDGFRPVSPDHEQFLDEHKHHKPMIVEDKSVGTICCVNVPGSEPLIAMQCARTSGGQTSSFWAFPKGHPDMTSLCSTKKSFTF